MNQTELIRNKQITKKFIDKYSEQEKIECVNNYDFVDLIMTKKEYAKQQNIPYSTFLGWLKQFSRDEQKTYARFKDAIFQANKEQIRDINQQAIMCLQNGQNDKQIENELRKRLVKLIKVYLDNENEFTCLIPVKFRNANKKNTLYTFVKELMDEFKQFSSEQQSQQNFKAY